MIRSSGHSNSSSSDSGKLIHGSGHSSSGGPIRGSGHNSDSSNGSDSGLASRPQLVMRQPRSNRTGARGCGKSTYIPSFDLLRGECGELALSPVDPDEHLDVPRLHSFSARRAGAGWSIVGGGSAVTCGGGRERGAMRMGAKNSRYLLTMHKCQSGRRCLP